jgi:hypothetical protein
VAEEVRVTETEAIEGVDEQHMMLTTFDNPFSPKTEYAQWQTWDVDNGYYTEQYIARLVAMEKDFDIDDAVSLSVLTDKVIQEVIEQDDSNIYVLV